MELHNRHTATRTVTRTAALVAAGLFGLATLAVSAGPAAASRLPADPITFVGTPAPVSRLIIDAQAANVWAALQDVHAS